MNALGLEAAKPKSILKLMNVDGLTKANIKSHLQKYRCLMQKKSQAAQVSSQYPTDMCDDGDSLSHLTAAASSKLQHNRESSIGLESASSCRGGTSYVSSASSSITGSIYSEAVETSGSSGVLNGLMGEVSRSVSLPEQLISQARAAPCEAHER